MIRRSVSVRSLQADVDAVAATEFAIVVPFLLALFIGGVELANGMAISVKVSATAHSVADMVTQNTSLSTSSMQNILTGASATIAPYSISDSSGKSLLTVTVSEVSSDANGNLTLQWSRSYNGATFGSGRTSLSGLTVPTSLNGTVGNAANPNNQNDQVSFIVGEVTYAYTPNLGFTISGTVNLTDTVWMFPRCSTDSPANSSGPAYYDVKYSTSTTTCTCLQHLQYKNC
ncbi:TadE/TadG family type IV pilus assembly protein [Rhodopseudomonas sp. BR0G17]|jgi:Flp pilus assembly protein TadG|uniref:TadE/TadG family type IV pilus assembly protein n=1 Tax=Rhodopseudomonas sp. BR0G17 TaxID=2269368 RepID=UPI0013E0263B|nr:TadE/TadG family type IV pilus assembly protein [Rhodopseudomonas sp. BR0G17]NEW95725.1 pilus assembly protein [Rhodopseudomonas sp. BR0G17]